MKADLHQKFSTSQNVIGSTDTQSDAGLQIMVENILRLRDGRPLLNPVDTKLRY